MDALEFLKERKRMCSSYEHCGDCPLKRARCSLISTSDEEYEKIIATVEQWSKEHPRKTRQSVLLEQWPEALRGGKDILSVCPQYLDSNITCERALVVTTADASSGCRR